MRKANVSGRHGLNLSRFLGHELCSKLGSKDVPKNKRKKKRGSPPKARTLKQDHSAKAWSEEAKREAVAMMERGDVTVTKLALDLGVSQMTLRRWRERFAAADATGAMSNEEKRELARLRKENETLRMERDILKKAATFFAKHRS